MIVIALARRIQGKKGHYKLQSQETLEIYL